MVALPAEDTWGEAIADLLADLERIHVRRTALTNTIEEVFLSLPLGAALVTLWGVGPRTGARTLAEIGDPNRFETGSLLAAYAGGVPLGGVTTGLSPKLPCYPLSLRHDCFPFSRTAAHREICSPLQFGRLRKANGAETRS